MTPLERTVWTVAIVSGVIACVAWYLSTPHHADGSLLQPIRRVTDVGVAPAESIDGAARVVTATDPFRLDRRPSSVAYRPDLDGVAAPGKPAKPQLALAGLVGRTALIDGAPGRVTTAIVHAGDTVGGLHIRHVGRDTVVVSDQDTTWRLTLRPVWH